MYVWIFNDRNCFFMEIGRYYIWGSGLDGGLGEYDQYYSEMCLKSVHVFYGQLINTTFN